MPPAVSFIPGPRHYRTKVAAGSAEQTSLVALCGPRRQERLNIKVRAQLVLQDESPQVQVSIQDHQVGHLSRTDAQALHRVVRYGERSVRETFECAALITGTAGNYSVQLDLPIDD